jgi:hypothetical protein
VNDTLGLGLTDSADLVWKQGEAFYLSDSSKVLFLREQSIHTIVDHRRP